MGDKIVGILKNVLWIGGVYVFLRYFLFPSAGILTADDLFSTLFAIALAYGLGWIVHQLSKPGGNYDDPIDPKGMM